MRASLGVLLVVLAAKGLAQTGNAPIENLPKAEDQLRWTIRDKIVGHRHMDQIFTSALIKAGGKPFKLPSGPTINPVYEFEGQSLHIDDYLRRTNATGLLVLYKGRIRLERYASGNGPRTRWASRSMAKSFTATAMGLALRDGYIRSLDDPVTRYLPELRGSRYAAARIRDVLTMSSGVDYIEDPRDPRSELPRLVGCLAAPRNGCMLSALQQIGTNARPARAVPGSHFSYSTADAVLAGLIVERATGMGNAEYLSRKVWKPFGMRTDGFWNGESVTTGTFGGSGLGATLRDYGRFGLYIARDGVLPNGTRTLPAGWMREATTPTLASKAAKHPYGFFWWIDDAANRCKGYAARGSSGQVIAIKPCDDVVIVKWAAWGDGPGANHSQEDDALFEAIVGALRNEA